MQVKSQRIAIGHPFLGRGGSESRVMWLIEALKANGAIDVLTTGGWNLDELNSVYGTTVTPDDVRVRIAPFARLFGRLSMAAWRGGLYQRFCRSSASQYDARISAYNFTDWGMPAMHFIADFCWLPAIQTSSNPPVPGFAYRDSLLRQGYLAIGQRLYHPTGRDFIKADPVIANSEWSANLIESLCGRRPRIIYPPVPGTYPAIPWEQKTPHFVCISRIEPEKRIEDAITILSRVRILGHNVKLHIVGGFPDTPYARKLLHLCRQNDAWVVLEGSVYGPRKIQLLSRFRYAIHTCRREAFGIAVAEMLKAGCLVFVPRLGGQAEIPAHDALLFDDEDSAVNRIDAVLKGTDLQMQLRTHLAKRASDFSSERFVEAVRTLLIGNWAER